MAYKKGMVTSNEIYKIITDGNLKYLILLGQRSNGKSYSAKELCISRAYKYKEQFIYLRRYREDINDYLTESYFSDIDIRKITDGKYNMVSIYRKGVYLANIDDDGNIERGDIIGYVRALSNAERYKSGAYQFVKYIIYEEFITDGVYLQNEVDKFDNFTSTVLRQRDGCVLLIGNTISRICPYYREFGLSNIKKQKQGTVDVYTKYASDENGNQIPVNVGVYWSGMVSGVSGMFFRKSAKMINHGDWERHDYPHLQGKLQDYMVLYQFVYAFDDNQFLCQLLGGYDNSYGCVWYISPKTTEIKNGTRLICRKPVINTSDYIWSKDIKSYVNDAERRVFNLIIGGYVVYSDDLCGEEFKQCLKNDGIII